jgi:hypothetical protein
MWEPAFSNYPPQARIPYNQPGNTPNQPVMLVPVEVNPSTGMPVGFDNGLNPMGIQQQSSNESIMPELTQMLSMMMSLMQEFMSSQGQFQAPLCHTGAAQTPTTATPSPAASGPNNSTALMDGNGQAIDGLYQDANGNVLDSQGNTVDGITVQNGVLTNSTTNTPITSLAINNQTDEVVDQNFKPISGLKYANNTVYSRADDQEIPGLQISKGNNVYNPADIEALGSPVQDANGKTIAGLYSNDDGVVQDFEGNSVDGLQVQNGVLLNTDSGAPIESMKVSNGKVVDQDGNAIAGLSVGSEFDSPFEGGPGPVRSNSSPYEFDVIRSSRDKTQINGFTVDAKTGELETSDDPGIENVPNISGQYRNLLK